MFKSIKNNKIYYLLRFYSLFILITIRSRYQFTFMLSNTTSCQNDLWRSRLIHKDQLLQNKPIPNWVALSPKQSKSRKWPKVQLLTENLHPIFLDIYVIKALNVGWGAFPFYLLVFIFYVINDGVLLWLPTYV